MAIQHDHRLELEPSQMELDDIRRVSDKFSEIERVIWSAGMTLV